MKIILTIKGQKVHLTVQEARELKNELDELFPVEWTPPVAPNIGPWPWSPTPTEPYISPTC